MTKTFTLICLLFVTISACGQKKQVVSSHENGNPEFVVWMKGKKEEAIVVKEEAYYADGKIEYTGFYKDEKEDGTWVYYYDNGNKKEEINYSEGVLDGTTYEYAPDGSLRLEIHYNQGRIEKEIRHK